MSQNKLNWLDRLFFISLIFIIPLMVEFTPTFGIFWTASIGVSYSAICAWCIRKISKNFGQED